MKTQRRAEAIWDDAKQLWRIKVQKAGVRKDFSSSISGRKGKHEAEAKADKWLESGTREMRFPDAWQIYLDYQRAHTGSSNNRQIEIYGRLYIAPVVGNARLSSITPIKWQGCIDAAHARGLSKRTCTNIRATIANFLTFADLQNWEFLPLKKGALKVPRDAPVGKRTILQPADIATLFREGTIIRNNHPVDVHYIHAWRFMVLTGMRRGEVCGLRREDISGNIVHIQRSVNEENELTQGKNENANRYFQLSKRAAVVLDQQLSMLEHLGLDTPWIFPDEQGERTTPRIMYGRWYRYRTQHGIQSSLHELRHTFVSAVKAEMPLTLLKSMIGHSDVMDTFGVYGHAMDGEMQQTADIVDSVFQSIENKVGEKVGEQK